MNYSTNNNNLRREDREVDLEREVETYSGAKQKSKENARILGENYL